MNNNTFYANPNWLEETNRSLELSPLPTAIPQLLNHVVNTLTPIANGKNQTLQCYADTHLNRCYLVDNIRLSEVLSNFISNAIKFTPQHGEIIVRAQLVERIDHNERIRFSVKDNGIGIAEETQSSLLTTNTQVGLGLAICQHLAKQLDGLIEFESKLGAGSIFSIILTLPICAPQETNIHHAGIAEETSANIKVKLPTYVLVVDDQPLSRELLAEIIKVQGFVVETATDGSQALSMWKTRQHPLIFTDCRMPHMDGYTFAKEIRHIEHAQHLSPSRIVAWTANLSENEQSRCKEAGIHDFLTKPINLTQLKKILTDHQSNHQIQTSNIEINDHIGSDNIPVDYTILEQVIPNTDKQTEVLHQLQTHVHHDYDELQMQVQKADLIGIESVAHRMKGSCKMVGVNGIAYLCEVIEKTAKNGNMPNPEETLSALHNRILEFDAFMHHQQNANVSKANPNVKHY